LSDYRAMGVQPLQAGVLITKLLTALALVN
jgi:hypothetical protein